MPFVKVNPELEREFEVVDKELNLFKEVIEYTKIQKITQK